MHWDVLVETPRLDGFVTYGVDCLVGEQGDWAFLGAADCYFEVREVRNVLGFVLV